MPSPPADGPLYIGIDVGGTNIKAGVVSDSGRTLSDVRVPTEADQGPEHGIANICRAAHLALEKAGLTSDDILAVGLATPGPMDIHGGVLLDPPNLPGWVELPIRERIAEQLAKPTVLQNDANAAAYGEYWVGAGREVHSLILLTLGTGVGCGIIYHDRIIDGEHSHGSESGHMIIQMDGGRFADTGQYGTLEAYCGSKGLVRRSREALHAGRSSSLMEVIAAGVELTPAHIGQAAADGDDLALEIVMETARCVGVATVSLMHTINPAMILYGGGVTFGRGESELGRRFLRRIKEEVHLRAFPLPAQKTRIDFATLGGAAGYVGAAGCARLAYGKGR